MKLIVETASVFMAQMLYAQMPADVVPMSNLSKNDLIQDISSLSSEVVMAARVNVTHDAASKNIRIFTTKEQEAMGPFKVNGYQIEVIYNPRVASSKVGVGSYRFQHNCAVMTFAAAKFSSGDKKLGLSILKLLVDAEPDLFWDSPQPVMPIAEIVKGLSKDDGSLKDFLSEEKETWNHIARNYGP